MGVSMYMQTVDAEGVALLASDPGAALAALTANGWSADQLGWAVFGLAAGVEGLDILAAGGFRLGEVALVSVRAQAQLLAAVNGVDRTVLEERFDDQAFGEPLGPEPLIADREWLVEAAVELIRLIESTENSELRLVWAIL